SGHEFLAGAVEMRGARASSRRRSMGPVPSDKETTMKYMLLIYSDEAAMAAASKKDTEQMHAAYGAYTEALTKAGVIAGGGRLRPTTTATAVRVANGK